MAANPWHTMQRFVRLPRRAVGIAARKIGIPLPTSQSYPRWIKQRLKERRCMYPAAIRPGLFSIVTPVFDPPARFLSRLAKSILAQDYPAWEWIIVDNGCTNPAVKRILSRLSFDPRVRYLPLPRNEGIVRGTRLALESATGKYVLPVDHDDTLYPDALRVTASYLQSHGEADLLYSDEDRLRNGRPTQPLEKPDWDPVMFSNCCYVTHLSVIQRELALQLDAYEDESLEGCQDWDLYCRFVNAGSVPRHIPEILYSWRMHSNSTAADCRAKPYALDAQERLLRRYLDQRGLSDRFELRLSNIPGAIGMWHFRRKQVHGDDLKVIMLTTGWQERVTAVEPDRKVALMDEKYAPESDDWSWEALGLFELHPDTAIIGGRVFGPDGRLRSCGEYFDADGELACPERGRRRDEVSLSVVCQKTVDGVDGGFMVAKADFLADVLRKNPEVRDSGDLALALAKEAKRRMLRVIYTPHITANCTPRTS